MKNRIVLDTSSLLCDGLAFQAFENSYVYIPFSVLEEMDLFKKDMGEKGKHARRFHRRMDALRKQGSLTQGVKFSPSSFLFVLMDKPSPHSLLDMSKMDHRILACALFLKKTYGKDQVQLITRDINLRIKADVFGIPAKDYTPSHVVDFEDMYTGIRVLKNLHDSELQQFMEKKHLPLTEGFLKNHLKGGELYPNQYVVLKTQKPPNGAEKAALARHDFQKKRISVLNSLSEPVWGINPQNQEQSFAFDALLDDRIMLVSLFGKAGTGKTLLALAAGLYKTLNENRFQKLLVSRPVFPMGRDIGYLPGDIEQKLNPWMQPVFDSVEFLMGMGKNSHSVKELMHQHLVSIEPLAYIRGRSIPCQYLIVDEAQNLTPHEMKTILTRAGQGTKVVLTGDLHQIDNPYVDSLNNGLVFAVERFKTESIAAHITLKQGERSLLAGLAANLL